jgi:hypothetical protein
VADSKSELGVIVIAMCAERSFTYCSQKTPNTLGGTSAALTAGPASACAIVWVKISEMRDLSIQRVCIKQTRMPNESMQCKCVNEINCQLNRRTRCRRFYETIHLPRSRRRLSADEDGSTRVYN